MESRLHHIYVEGDMFGEWELSRDTTRAFTAVSHTYCTLVRVPRSCYFRIFRSLRTKASLISYCTNILLNVAADQRTPDDLSALHDMIRGLEKFQILDRSMTHHLSKQISCITRPKGHILFYEGDEGDSFYLVLRGTVGIYKRIEDEQKKPTAPDGPQRATHAYMMHITSWEGPSVCTADKKTFARRLARYNLALYVYAKDLNIPHTTNATAAYAFTHQDLLRDVDKEVYHQTQNSTSMLQRINCSVLFKKQAKWQESNASTSRTGARRSCFLRSGTTDVSSDIVSAQPSQTHRDRHPTKCDVPDARKAAATASEQHDGADVEKNTCVRSTHRSSAHIRVIHPEDLSSVHSAGNTRESSSAGRVTHHAQSAIVDPRAPRRVTSDTYTRGVRAGAPTHGEARAVTDGCPAGYSTIFNRARRRDKCGSREAQCKKTTLRRRGKHLVCVDACWFRLRRCSSAPPPLSRVAAVFDRPYNIPIRHKGTSDGEELLERDLMGVNTESDESDDDNEGSPNGFTAGQDRAEKISEVDWMATHIRHRQASFRVSYYKTELAVHDPAPPNAARLLTLRMAVKGYLARKARDAVIGSVGSSLLSHSALLPKLEIPTEVSSSHDRTRSKSSTSGRLQELDGSHKVEKVDVVNALPSRGSNVQVTKTYDHRRTFINADVTSLRRPTQGYARIAGGRGTLKIPREPSFCAVPAPQADESKALEQQISTQSMADAKFFATHKLLLEMGIGEAFGEWALLRNERRVATVRLLTDCDLLTISKATYDDVVREKRGGEVDMEKCTLVLRKLPNERANSDLDVLDTLIRENDFFIRLNVCLRRELCKYMQYRALFPDEILFQQGEMADAFYLVLLGKVGVYMAAQGETTDGTQVISGNEELVATLYKGSTFGEWGLQQDMPRTATIKAFCRCDLLEINKPTYVRILKEYRQQTSKLDAATQIVKTTKQAKRSEDQVRHLCEFLKGKPFFDGLRPVILQACCQRLRYVSIPAHQTLFHKGDFPDAMYILLKGDVVVTGAQKRHVDVSVEDVADASTELKTTSHDATEKERLPEVDALPFSNLLSVYAPLWCGVHNRLAVFANDLTSATKKTGSQWQPKVARPIDGPSPFSSQFARAFDKVEQGIHVQKSKMFAGDAKKNHHLAVGFVDESTRLPTSDADEARSMNDAGISEKFSDRTRKTMHKVVGICKWRQARSRDADAQKIDDAPVQIREGDVLGAFSAHGHEVHMRSQTLQTTTTCELLQLTRGAFYAVMREEMLREQAEQTRVLSTLIRPTPPSNTIGTCAPPVARTCAIALAQSEEEEQGTDEDPAAMLAKLSLYFRMEKFTKGAAMVMASWRSAMKAESMIQYVGPVNVRYEGRADSERLYILSEGTCEVEHRGTVTDILLPGQILNGCSLLLQKKEPFQITVSSPEAHFLSISHSDLMHRCPEYVVGQLHRLAATQDSFRRRLQDSLVQRAAYLALRDARATHVNTLDDRHLDLIHSPFLRHKTCDAAGLRHGKRNRAMFARIKLFQLVFDDYMPPEIYSPRSYFTRMYKHADSFLNIRFTPYPEFHDSANDGHDGDGNKDGTERLKRPRRRRTITRGTTYSDPIIGESACDCANRCFLRAKDAIDAHFIDDQQSRAALPAIPHHVPHPLLRDGDAADERSPSSMDVATPYQLVSYLRTQPFEFADPAKCAELMGDKMTKVQHADGEESMTGKEAYVDLSTQDGTKYNRDTAHVNPAANKLPFDELQGRDVAFRVKPSHDASPSLPNLVHVQKCTFTNAGSNELTTNSCPFFPEHGMASRPNAALQGRTKWNLVFEQCAENAPHTVPTGTPRRATRARGRGRGAHWLHRGRKVIPGRVKSAGSFGWNAGKRQELTPRWRSCHAGNARGSGNVDDWSTLFSAIDRDWGTIFTT